MERQSIRDWAGNFLRLRILATTVGMAAAAVGGGCGMGPPIASYAQSAGFDPFVIERVALIVSDVANTRPRGSAGSSTYAGRAVESTFQQVLTERGYQVVGDPYPGAATAVLKVTVEERGVRQERAEFKDKDGRIMYVTYHIARAFVSAQLDGAGREVLWSSQQIHDCRSDESPGDARDCALSEAAGRVARAFPYRRLPLDKRGQPYDPRDKAAKY